MKKLSLHNLRVDKSRRGQKPVPDFAIFFFPLDREAASWLRNYYLGWTVSQFYSSRSVYCRDSFRSPPRVRDYTLTLGFSSFRSLLAFYQSLRGQEEQSEEGESQKPYLLSRPGEVAWQMERIRILCFKKKSTYLSESLVLAEAALEPRATWAQLGDSLAGLSAVPRRSLMPRLCAALRIPGVVFYLPLFRLLFSLGWGRQP